jgi:acyl dehydratase
MATESDREPERSEGLASGSVANAARPSKELYLDDLALGQSFTSGSHPVTAEAIKSFARQFDPQPFHLDEAVAAQSFFGGLAASGWHTAAITMKLLVESGMRLSGGLIGAGGELTWPRPTRPGDVLTVVTQVLAVTPSRSRPERGFVTVRCETRNQHGEPVQVMTSRMLVWRRAG